MSTQSFTANLEACQGLLRNVQEYLLSRRSQYMAEIVETTRSNLYTLQQQHEEAVDLLQRANSSLRDRHAEDRTALEDARRTTRSQEERVARRDAIINNQNRELARNQQTNEENIRNAERTSYREGVQTGQATIRALEEQNQTLNQAITQQTQTIRTLRRDLERAEVSVGTGVADAYQRGFNDGQQDERNRIRPPPTPPTPVINILGRESILREIKLTNASGHTLSANLEGAIKQGQPEVLATVLQFEQVRAPALHMAALFGDVPSAELLLQAGANVNESCTARSETGSGHLYGVTPMHLAVAAQHEGMIRCLQRHGGNFSFGSVRSGQRATGTPALWLLSERWLRLSGRGDSRHVLRTLRTMRSCGWDSGAAVDRDGDSLRTVVYRSLSGRPQLLSDVLGFLASD